MQTRAERYREDRLNMAPVGTRAPAIGGGHWYRTEQGWKWNGPGGSGGTFPRPGGDWNGELLAPGEPDLIESIFGGDANV